MRACKIFAAGMLLASLFGESRAYSAPRDQPIPALGFEFSLGAGVVGFTQANLADATKIGASWSARFVIGTRAYFSAEVAYFGSVQRIEMTGLEDGSRLASHAFEGALRFNLNDLGRWQPYTFAGLAYRHYEILNQTQLFRSDVVGETPIGGGLAFRYAGFVADLRLEFRPSFDNDLMSTGGPEDALHNWGANASIGCEL